MVSRRKLGIVIASVAMLGIVPVFGAKASAPTDWAANLPGCHADNPAVGHHANQQVLADQSNGPVPCGMLTGWPTVETRVEVTNDNAVIQEPALLTICPVLGGSGHIYGCGGCGEGLARTFNDGGKWDAVSVQVPPDLIVEEGGVDNNMYVDHDTGRLFFYLFGPHYLESPLCLVPGVNPATIAYSDDNGTTWTWGFDLDHACSENPTVLTAKPTPSGEQPSGYPNVVYLCGDDTSTGVGGTGNPGFSCSKSLAGGSRWLGSIIQGTVLNERHARRARHLQQQDLLEREQRRRRHLEHHQSDSSRRDAAHRQRQQHVPVGEGHGQQNQPGRVVAVALHRRRPQLEPRVEHGRPGRGVGGDLELRPGHLCAGAGW